MSDIESDYCNEWTFESLVKEREQELSKLAHNVLSSIQKSERYLGTLLQNPRANSTSLAQREIALRRSILRGLEEFNSAALICAKRLLQLNLDHVELRMIKEARAKSSQEKELRRAGIKVYEGAREFFDELCFSHRVDSHMLAALNAHEIEQVAAMITSLLATRLDGVQ